MVVLISAKSMNNINWNMTAKNQFRKNIEKTVEKVL